MLAQHGTLLPSLAGQSLWPEVSVFGPGPSPDTVCLFPSAGQAEGQVLVVPREHYRIGQRAFLEP